MPAHIIGLTGSIGTGKSTAAAMFKSKGAAVIDADAITRDLLTKNSKCMKKVAKLFPDVILRPGEINRKKLSDVVFQNPRELKKLTDCLYPEALKQVKKQISLYKRSKKQFIILDVPLLFEAGWDRLADTTLVVTARRTQQIERVHKRMRIPQSQIVKRLKNQMPLKAKCLLADIVLDNSGALDETRRQVNAIMDRLSKRKG